MTKTKGKAKKTAPRKGRKGGKGRSKNLPDYVCLSETRSMIASGGVPFVNNQLYSLMDTSLSQFRRATQVAQAYQHYRIKYIQVKIKSTFDTYAVNFTQPNSKPYLYYMIDKAGAIPTNVTLEGLKNAGAKPRALDETTRLIGWKPSVLEASMTAGGGAGFVGQGAKYTMTPWLNTNANSVNPGVWVPSTVDHLGVYWFVDALTNPSPSQPYEVEVEVQFEFKKPFIANAVGQFHATPALPRQINASRDGVVDAIGEDGDDRELAQ